MKTLQFKVTLKSDIILNQKSASQGNNQTLDFIPGSCFLGIAAGKLYNEKNDTLALFHSGEVRWGDAHLGKDGNRGNKVPSSMFYPKLKKPYEELYIHHATEHDDEEIKKKQLKQCRSGFYDFSQNPAVELKADTAFAIKSARDKDSRTSKDSQMFGYESLCQGAVMYFEVEVDDDNLAELIVDALVGKKRIGRSRTAQYGLVKIEQCKFGQIESRPAEGNLITVYADSRLIFIDENTGMPTFQPTPEMLGITGGKIRWDLSQVRTFQYAPWNFTRQCFDTDRCGIEKGSVLVIEGGTLTESKTKYVGSYRNEGFGRVIYNPAFLDANADGTAKICFEKPQDKENPAAPTVCDGSTGLLKYLDRQCKQMQLDQRIYKAVENWMIIDSNQGLFAGDAFASQWGEICSLASNFEDETSIYERLFAKETGYLMHGAAEEKWSKRQRRVKLHDFVDKFKDDEESIKRLALINLAAEMGKYCNKKDKK